MPVRPDIFRDRYANDPEFRAHRLAINKAWRDKNLERTRAQDKASKQRQKDKDPEKFRLALNKRQNDRNRRVFEANPEIQRDRLRNFLKRKSPEWHAERTAHRRSLREAKKTAISGRPRPEICDICGGNRIRIVFDHCHKTGEFRGWICSPCNTVLGLMNDDAVLLRKLADYLEKNPANYTPVTPIA